MILTLIALYHQLPIRSIVGDNPGGAIMATIGNMTIEQLQQLIDQRIDERLTNLLGAVEIADEDDEQDNRTWEQVKQDIERDRWTPPPGAKCPPELLQQDRDC